MFKWRRKTKKRKLQTGDICVITSTYGHCFRVGERVVLIGQHHSNFWDTRLVDSLPGTWWLTQYISESSLRYSPGLEFSKPKPFNIRKATKKTNNNEAHTEGGRITIVSSSNGILTTPQNPF